MDPKVTAVMQSSLTSYRHELLTENFAGIPIMQQHGGNDDNVPVYHSRRMSQLINQSNWASEYVELPGKGHWFTGAMTTRTLRTFYSTMLSNKTRSPSLPQRLRIVVPASGEMGSRAGIVVDQLVSPDQLGIIDISIQTMPLPWVLKTSNIHRFHLSNYHFLDHLPSALEIDGITVASSHESILAGDFWFVRTEDGSWLVSGIVLCSD